MTTISLDVIVGNGIAAHAFLWTYALKLKEQGLDHTRRVLWIKSKIVPTCSLTSTSLISSAGLQYGVSELGDLLLKSYEEFVSISSNFESISKAKQTHLLSGDLENFNKRYPTTEGECFLVQSKNFLLELETKIKNILGTKLEERIGTVLSWDENLLHLHGNEQIKFDRCFLGLGAGIKLLSKAPNTKSVSGSYAYTFLDLGKDSFVFSKGSENVIYRAADKCLLVGSIDEKDDEFGWPVMAGRGHKLKQALSTFDIDLPNDLDWKVESGVRHKGQKRRPYWGEINPNVFAAHSFYKNGYTLAFLAAKDLTSKWF